MKKLVLVAATAAFLGVSAPAMSSGIPVFDGTRAADFIQQMVKVKEQIDVARNQLAEAQRMYESVTGVRGLGDVLRNPQLRQFLPDDLKSVYDSANGGGYAGISGSLKDILDAEKITSGDWTQLRQIHQRGVNAAATDKAVGLRAYEGAQARLNQIEGLMDQIGKTQDQKAIEELQARIAGEQASIANEMTKLQMISQLRAAEQNLVAEQKRAVSLKILNSQNQGMPGIR